MQRLRRTPTAHSLAVAGLLAFAALLTFMFVPGSAVAAVDARVSGSTDVNVKNIRFDGDRGSVGSVAIRRYTFTPQCGSGVCDRIKLTRRMAVGSATYMLKRTAKGTWRGDGFNSASWYGCSNGTTWKGSFDEVKLVVESAYETGPRAGSAKRIRMDVSLRFTRFTSARGRTVCGKYLRKYQGLKVGDRPIAKYVVTGRF